MRSLWSRFLIRWFVGSTGLWLAAVLLDDRISYNGSSGVIIGAGLVLAILNMVLRPILVILSFPAVILSLGLFMIIINGFVVYLVSVFYPPLHFSGFWSAVFAGIVIGLINYVVTRLLEENE